MCCPPCRFLQPTDTDGRPGGGGEVDKYDLARLADAIALPSWQLIGRIFLDAILHFLPHLLVFLPHHLHYVLLNFLQLSLISPNQFAEFSVDDFSSRSVSDILPFIHQLSLDLQHDRVIPYDLSNDFVSGFGGVDVACKLCALVEERFEKSPERFLVIFTNLGRDFVPHVGDENDVFQCSITAEFPGHPKIPFGDSGKPFVGDTLDVDDPSKPRAFLVSIKKFSPGDQETTNVNVDSRGGQESCNRVQNIRIAP